MCQIDSHHLGCPEQHARFWFPGRMGCIGITADGVWMMRAGENSVESGAGVAERNSDRILYRLKFLPAIVSAAYACLVGDHDDRHLSAIGSSDGFSRPGYQCNVLGPMKIRDQFNNHAVTVQEEAGADLFTRRAEDLTPEIVVARESVAQFPSV